MKRLICSAAVASALLAVSGVASKRMPFVTLRHLRLDTLSIVFMRPRRTAYEYTALGTTSIQFTFKGYPVASPRTPT